MKSFGRRHFGESKDSGSFGHHGSNRLHYIPSVSEIKRRCALLRERWDKHTLMERKGRVGV